MSCKACLYAANTASQTMAAGNNVNFGSLVRRYGKSIGLAGGNAVVSGEGYYDAMVNITFEGTAAGTATFSIYSDGVMIPGATASVTTEADAVTQICITAVLREKCCCGSTITVGFTGTSVNVTNAAIVIEKV